MLVVRSLLVLSGALAAAAIGWLAGVTDTEVRDARGVVEVAVTHFTHVPFDRLWSVAGLRGWPELVRWLPLACGLPLGILALRSARPGPPARPARAIPAVSMGAFVLGAWIAWQLRVSPERNALFGDGPALAGQLEAGRGGFAAEALTVDLFVGARWLLGKLGVVLTMREAIELVTFACAGIFLAAAIDLGRSLGRSDAERTVIALGVATTAGIVQLFGYVETTGVAFTAIAVYLASGVRAASCNEPSISRSEIVAHCALGVALASHAAAISVAPSLIFLHARPHRGARSATTWLLVVALTLVPWLASAVLPHYARGQLGNVEGGADRNRFLPLELDPLNLPSRTIYYALLSRLHRLELANACAIGALATPFLALAWLARRAFPASWRERVRPADRRRGLFLLAAAAGALSVVVLWSFDFGLYGDWNIVTTYLLPLHVAGWALVPGTSAQPPGAVASLAYAPLLAAQAGMLVGWYAQFV